MKTSALIVICVLLLGVATGCSTKYRISTIRCNYARTQNLPIAAELKTFAFDTDSNRRGTHEYEIFCDRVATVLTAYGWLRVDAPNKAPLEKPDCWITVVYGYALDSTADLGGFKRIAAPSLVPSTDYSASDYYGRVAAYYAAVNITSQPRGEGDNLFLAQIFGSSDAEMILVLPAMFDQLLKDFPGENVSSRDVTLRTR